MRYYIIAGEASGDLHGANLIRGIMRADSNADIWFRGGDLMREAGGTMLCHYRETAVMGYLEVFANIGKVIGGLRDCKREIKELTPDLVILIDYPGFNMKIAAYAANNGIPVYYYISPKIWAWKEWRIKAIKRNISRLYIILPFEKEFFLSHNYQTEYFGNPLVDQIEGYLQTSLPIETLRSSLELDDRPVMALLPGSRLQEVRKILPAMLSVVKYYPDYQFIIAGSTNIDDLLYDKLTQNHEVRVIKNRTYDLLSLAEVALVKSGTSTLEAALLGTPQVVCYRLSSFSYLLGRLLIRKIRFFSLVNLLMDKEVVKELLQGQLNERNLVREINTLIRGGWKREIMLGHYAELKEMLGEPGVSDRVAVDMVSSLNNERSPDE